MMAKEIRQAAAVYLSRYRAAKGEVKDIELRIERVRSEMMGVKGISYEGGDMPKAKYRSGDLSDYVARVEDIMREWRAAQLRALETMSEIAAAIDTVQDDHARRVLMLYYVDGYKFEEISRKIPCGIDSVYRWRRIGLLELGQKLNSKS